MGPQGPQNTGTGAPCVQNHQLCVQLPALHHSTEFLVLEWPKRDSHCLAAGLEFGDAPLLAGSCAGTACTFSQRIISMSSLTLPVELSFLQRGSSSTFSYLKVRAQKIRDNTLFMEKILHSFCSRWKSVLRILPSGTVSAENSSSKPPIGSGFSGTGLLPLTLWAGCYSCSSP